VRGFAALAYGENADDPQGARPGSLAAREFAVLAPLREAGLGKADVREVARRLGLNSHDAPSQPCLSSRIPHGTSVTREAVELIERGERAVRSFGFRILRVRLARVEPPSALVQVAPSELPALYEQQKEVDSALRRAGFADVQIDPTGYRGAGIA
jgi:pyridinium-3,5-biscarboxylic acid mononucleotide sulfurtransferase